MLVVSLGYYFLVQAKQLTFLTLTTINSVLLKPPIITYAFLTIYFKAHSRFVLQSPFMMLLLPVLIQTSEATLFLYFFYLKFAKVICALFVKT